MQLTYDPEVDAAYLRLVDHIAPGQAIQTIGHFDTPNGQSQFLLDFDDDGRLLGIEFLWAAGMLSPELLATAVLPGTDTHPAPNS